MRVIEFYKTVNNIECVQPQDRLVTLLMDLATSQFDAFNTISQYRKRNRRDSRVLERLRVTQAMFLVVQEAKGLTLNLVRGLIDRPDGQTVDSESESESSDKNIKEEMKEQKEQEKKIIKD